MGTYLPLQNRFVSIGRRQLLVTMALSGVGALMYSRPARADPVTVILGAIALTQAVLNMSRESGSLEKRIAAAELQLNAITTGIARLTEAQLLVSRQVAEVGKALKEIPEKTNSLALVNEIKSRETGLLWYLDPQRESSKEARLENVRRALIELEGFSAQLEGGVLNFDSEPLLVTGAFSLNRAAEVAHKGLVKMKMYGGEDKARVRQVLATTNRALAAMTSKVDAGQPSLPKMLKSAIVQTDLIAADLSKRWPAFTTDLLPAKFESIQTAALNSESAQFAVCYRGETIRHGISSEEIWADVPGKENKMTHLGKIVVSSFNTATVRLVLERKSQPVHTKRRIYSLTPISQKDASHVKVVKVSNGGVSPKVDVVISESPNSILDGCILYGAVGGAYYSELEAFFARLSDYDSWAAMEGYYSAILEKSEQEIARVDKILATGKV